MAIVTILGTDHQNTSLSTINSNFAYLASLAVQPGGSTVAITVGASPFTYTAGATAEVVFISGGAVTSVTRHGVNISNGLPACVPLPPGESVVVTYDEAPLMVADK